MALRDTRGGRIRLELPDVPVLRKEIKTYREMLAERRTTASLLVELEAKRPAAKREDQEAFAAAILKLGSEARDPGGKHSDKLEQEIAQVRSRRDAADVAVERAESSLIAAVDAKREAMLREADKKLDAIRGEYRTAVEELLEIRLRRDDQLSLRYWLEGFPHQTTQLRTTPRPVQGIKSANGAPLSSVALAAALREDIDGPPKPTTMPQPETPNPLRPTSPVMFDAA